VLTENKVFSFHGAESDMNI